MGGWQLEVFKMTCYVSLPVLCFYFFNKPEYFQNYVAETKQYYFIKEDPNTPKLIAELKQKMEKEREAKLVAEIEELKKAKNKS